jgi:dynein intermediate chain 2, axonemal
MLSSIAVQGTLQQGGKLIALGDVTGTVSLLELCESLAVPQANERKAIDLMFEREMKQEKNLEARERDLRRQRTAEADQRTKEAHDKKDSKDEKMEALLRKVDADFLGMIKEAEDDESKAAEATPMESGDGAGDDK